MTRPLSHLVQTSVKRSCATLSSSTARSFSTSGAAHATQSVVQPRPPIPADVVRIHRPATSTSSSSPPSTRDGSEDPVSAQGESAVEGSDSFIPPPPVSLQTASLLYSYTTPPPLSALSAFASRISSSECPDLADHLELVEQCLIHESFWHGVDQLPPPPPPPPSSSSSSSSSTAPPRRTYTHFHDEVLADSPSTTPVHSSNAALAQLGNSLLGTLATELVLSSFPNLPVRVTKAALTMYVGPKSLANVARQWGVGPSRLDHALVGREDEAKVSRKDKAYGHLVGGRGGARKLGDHVGAKEGAAGSGLIRWNRKPTEPTKDAVLFEDALASVSRAVVGAVYQLHGFAAARSFVHSHFLSRLVPNRSTDLASASASASIVPLLKFQNPSRLLSLQLASSRAGALSHKVLKESGRLSAHPTFVVGAYSGACKVGEGFGSSIKMAEWRASEDALRRAYLGGGRLDKGQVGVPSDQWVQGGNFEGWSGGVNRWVEVEHESRS